jgi:hypothetical protein
MYASLRLNCDVHKHIHTPVYHTATMHRTPLRNIMIFIQFIMFYLKYISGEHSATTFFVDLKLSGVSISLHHFSITVYWYYQLRIN